MQNEKPKNNYINDNNGFDNTNNQCSAGHLQGHNRNKHELHNGQPNNELHNSSQLFSFQFDWP